MSASTIFDLQQTIARYSLSTLLILGNVGNLLTILILTRSLKQKRNSCSLYILSASISNWMVINTALVSNLVGIDHVDPQNTSNLICKLRWAGVHALLMLSRSFMIAACIDRWALCSTSLTIRAFSQPRQALRVISILLVVWTIIPVHLVIYFNNDTGRCLASAGVYALFYAIYSLLVIGICPLLLMTVFSLLAWRNLRLSRTRVTPMVQTIRSVKIRKHDRILMKMLTGEVFVYCVTTIPYPIGLIYNVSTSTFTAYKTPVRKAIESLVGYIISPILNFTYCCVQFYVYAICSREFRKSFLDLFRHRQRTRAANHHIPMNVYLSTQKRTAY